MFRRFASVGVVGFVFLACGNGEGLKQGLGQSNVRPAQGAPPAPPDAPAPSLGRVTAQTGAQGSPTFIWANRDPAARAPAAPGASIESVARAHLQRFASHYRLAPGETEALELRDVHDTGRGAIVARFQRRVDGIEVFGEQLAVTLDRNLQPVALTGNVSSALPDASKAPARVLPARFTLDPVRAVIAALRDVTQISLDTLELEAPSAAAGGYQTVSFERAAAKLGASSTEPARVKRVLYPMPAAPGGALPALEPAYYVETDLGPDAEDEPRYFAFVIGARAGNVLWKRNLTAQESFSYRVYAEADDLFTPWDGPQGSVASPHPTEVLDNYQAPFVAQNLVTLSSLDVVGVTDPWLPPGATQTLGNNVDAFLDIVLPDGFTPGQDFRGSVSAPGMFDYTHDPAVSADADEVQRQSAITQLFYNLNWFHDWYYAAGFTEAAGNAQSSNYGRGGVEGDSIRAEGQNASGTNNANMSTPADGGRPRMRMYLWDYGTSSLVVSAPASLAGSFRTRAGLGPTRYALSGPLLRADPPDGCAPLVGDFTGAVVLIDRGGCTGGFALKAQNAQVAGAIGAVIANVPSSPNPGAPPAIGGTPAVPIVIGVLGLNLADGDRLRDSLAQGESVSVGLAREARWRDGDVDNQIVAHEWGHYISNRLVGNAGGLDTRMAGSLGEGWADFHALLITVRAEDIDLPNGEDWSGAYSVGGFATGASDNSYYYGVRRYPYSTDMTKSPLTFKHISAEGLLPDDVPRAFDSDHTEVHNAGEVWAAMLWECYAALLRDTLPPARLTFAEARDRMRDYLVAAYKITPRSPTLLEARDALLASAIANDPLDYSLFAAAFAKRGAGVGAIGPDRYDQQNSGIVESYATGAALGVSSLRLLDDVEPVCTADGILDAGETGTLEVVFRNFGSVPSGTLNAQVSSTNPELSFPDGDSISIPPAAIEGTSIGSLRVRAHQLQGLSTLDFLVQVPDAGAGAPAPFQQAFLGNADQVSHQSFTDGAESAHVVWGVEATDPALPDSAVWQRSADSATEHHYHCVSGASSGSVDFVSPPLHVLPGARLTLAFRQRFDFESGDPGSFDGGVIEISRDGGTTWQDVGAATAGYTGMLVADGSNPLRGRAAFTGVSPDYPAYVPAALDLGDADGGTDVRLRFRVASDAGGASPGWDIDDITFGGVSNPTFDSLEAQPSSCNTGPIATGGTDQNVPESSGAPDFTPTVVTLDASASFDADGHPLTYLWLQISGPPVGLSDASAAWPSFSAPQVSSQPGTERLAFQLVVSDGQIASQAKLSSVTVRNVNRPPSANAGASQTVDEGSLVRLNGAGSSDLDAEPLSYSWSAPPEVALSDADSAQPSFMAPDVDGERELTFTLRVSDGLETSAPGSVVVNVRERSAPSAPGPTDVPDERL